MSYRKTQHRQSDMVYMAVLAGGGVQAQDATGLPAFSRLPVFAGLVSGSLCDEIQCMKTDMEQAAKMSAPDLNSQFEKLYGSQWIYVYH